MDINKAFTKPKHNIFIYLSGALISLIAAIANDDYWALHFSLVIVWSVAANVNYWRWWK